jgi:hypothetical protein
MPVPLGLRLKARLLVSFCRVWQSLVSEPERAEALAALRRGYERLARAQARGRGRERGGGGA